MEQPSTGNQIVAICYVVSCRSGLLLGNRSGLEDLRRCAALGGFSVRLFLMDLACMDGSQRLGSFVGRVVVRVKGEQPQPGAVSPGHCPVATGDSQ